MKILTHSARRFFFCTALSCGLALGCVPVNEDPDGGNEQNATDAGNSTADDAGNSTAEDAGNSTAADAGSSTAADAGSSTAADAGSSAAADAGSSTAADAGSSTAADAGNSTAADAGSPAFTEPAGVEGVVAAHNRVRAGAVPTPVPALPDLVWSQSAADVARAWAAQCKWGHNPGRGALGENIAVWSGTNDGSGVAGTELWGAEMSIYDLESNSCSGEACGHYTQIVWRNTTSVGCALQTCDVMEGLESFGRSQFLVCDYAPPGNYIGQRPY